MASLWLISFILYSIVVSILVSGDRCDMCTCNVDNRVLVLNCTNYKTKLGDNNEMIRQPYLDSYERYTYETIEAFFESNRIKRLARITVHRLISLSVAQNEITHIDAGTFARIKTLKTLSLKNNKLQTVDGKSFNGLSNLEILDLSYNMLTNLPSGTFSALTSLKTLFLSHNAIESLEGEVFAIRTLQSLDVSFNSITEIGLNVFENAANLRTLNLSNNNIAKIDSHRLASLEILDLSFNKNMTVDQYAFWNLKSLKWLSFSSNNLEEVPAHVANLAELRVLHLEGNVFKDIGDAVKKLKLEELYVQDNNLQNFDVNSVRLRVLNVSSNSLTSFSSLDYPALEVLDLSSNQLSAVPDVLTGLRTPALRWLTLDDNPMTQVRFPTAGKEEQDGDLFVNLTWVSMSHMSKLEHLEAGAFSGLSSPCGECSNGVQKSGVEDAELAQECSRKLVIRVAHNPRLVKIDEEAFKDVGICSLDLSYNALSFLPELLTRWESLEWVNLQGNPWDCTCRLQWMLDRVLPRIYYNSTFQELLYELRCNTPAQLRNKRLVHFISWDQKAFCSKMEQLRAATEPTGMDVNVGFSAAMLGVVVGLGTIILILIIVGIVMQRRFLKKQRLRNRRK